MKPLLHFPLTGTAQVLGYHLSPFQGFKMVMKSFPQSETVLLCRNLFTLKKNKLCRLPVGDTAGYQPRYDSFSSWVHR
jgi:hypothetical protein